MAKPPLPPKADAAEPADTPDPPPAKPDKPPARAWVPIATRCVLVAAILAAGMLVFGGLVATRATPPRNPPNENARRVVTFELQPVTISRPWRGYGTAESVDSADVPARVSATVVDVPQELRAGVSVTQGQVLARLDPSDFERTLAAERDRAEDLRSQLAQLDLEEVRLKRQLDLDKRDVEIMQRELERLERLRATNAAQQKDLDDSSRTLIATENQLAQTTERLDALPARRRALEAQAAAQRAAVEQSEADLARTTIVSPIDGVLESVDVEVGEQVAVGERVARVVRLSAMEVGLALPASARASVAVGDRAVLETLNGRQRWVGEIGRVSPRDDADARTVTVFVDVDQPGAESSFGTRDGAGLLTPGVFVSGWATGERVEGCWVVPRRTVRQGRVMTAATAPPTENADAPSLARARSVAVDVLFTLSDGDLPESARLEGLPDAEWVVIEGRDAPLDAGLEVLITPPADLRDGALIEPVAVQAALSTTRAEAAATREPTP
ncbi:MAG: HlyD family efflux transporter periplasmic adaptor subunit [Planctomycetota bacterium]